MPKAKLYVVCFILIYTIYEGIASSFKGLQVIPERADIVYTNDKYVWNKSISIRRYKRRGDYVINLCGTTKQTWDNNVTIDVVLYEYLNNEYKRSFVEIHLKFCDMVNSDPLLSAQIKMKGIQCPMAKGYYKFTNVTMTFPKFPYKFPLEKFMAEITFRSQPSHDIIGKGHLYITAKQLP